MRRTLFIYLLMIITLAGCNFNEKEIQRSSLSITPQTLTQEETQSLKQSLLSSSGKIGISYKGDKAYLNLRIEMWRNGEKQNEIPLGQLEIRHIDQSTNSYDGSCILSINQMDSGYNATISCEDHLSKEIKELSYHIEQNKHTAIMSISLTDKLDTYMDKETLLWGVQASNTNILQTMDLTNESLKRSEWAVVFNVLPDN